MFSNEEQDRVMVQSEIDEQYIKTLDVNNYLYHKTILSETQLNLGFNQTGIQRDLMFVNNRYI